MRLSETGGRAWKVLIPDRLTTAPDVEQAVLGVDTVFLTPGARSAAEVPEAHWQEADAILAWHEVHISDDIIARLRSCRVIVRIGTGFDNIDIESAGRHDIPVCNVPDYGTGDVADHALALILALARGIVAYDAAAMAGRWDWDAAGRLRRLDGTVCGIVGLGRIGTATALRAKAFGMRVLYYDPYKDAGYDKALGIERVWSLGALLERSDVVTLHTPLTAETRRMADASFFARLKHDAIFINVARGPCVDLDALHDALRSGRLRGAGLDVLPEEPPASHPMIEAWRQRESWIAGRLVITPHAAFYNRESYTEMRRKAAEEARRVLAGEGPRHCVNGALLRSAQSPRIPQ